MKTTYYATEDIFKHGELFRKKGELIRLTDGGSFTELLRKQGKITKTKPRTIVASDEDKE